MNKYPIYKDCPIPPLHPSFLPSLPSSISSSPFLPSLNSWFEWKRQKKKQKKNSRRGKRRTKKKNPFSNQDQNWLPFAQCPPLSSLSPRQDTTQYARRHDTWKTSFVSSQTCEDWNPPPSPSPYSPSPPSIQDYATRGKGKGWGASFFWKGRREEGLDEGMISKFYLRLNSVCLCVCLSVHLPVRMYDCLSVWFSLSINGFSLGVATDHKLQCLIKVIQNTRRPSDTNTFTPTESRQWWWGKQYKSKIQPLR